MVEPISAVVGGLALARQGIQFLKDNMDSASDAAEIGRQIANIFQGHDEFNKKRYKESSLTLGNIAEEMIEYKLQQEEMYELKTLVNLRFGHGFWESIVSERQKRIEHNKEMAKEEARAKRQKRQEMIDTAQTFGIGLAIAISLGVAILVFFLTRAS